MNKKMNLKFFVVMNLVANIPMSLAMAITGPIVSHQPVFTPNLLVNLILGFVLSVLINLLFPIPKISAAVPAMLKLKPESLAGRLVGNAVPAFIFIAIIGLVMNFYNVYIVAGVPGPVFLFAYIESFLPMYVVCYIVSFIFIPIAMKAAIVSSGT